MEENVFTFAFAECGSTLHYSKTETVCSYVFSVEDVVGDDICQLGYLYSKRRSVEIKDPTERLTSTGVLYYT